MLVPRIVAGLSAARPAALPDRLRHPSPDRRATPGQPGKVHAPGARAPSETGSQAWQKLQACQPAMPCGCRAHPWPALAKGRRRLDQVWPSSSGQLDFLPRARSLHPPGETPTEHPEKRQPEPRLARSTLKWAIALPFSAKQTASAPVQDFIVVNGQFAALRRHAGGLPLIRSQAPREPARNNPPSTAGSGRLPRNSRARCCPPGSPLLRFPSGSIARSLPFLPARSPARSP